MRKQDEDRNGKPEALLWLDFETTGTDRNDSLPLEVGMECTDVLGEHSYGSLHRIIRPDYLDLIGRRCIALTGMDVTLDGPLDLIRLSPVHAVLKYRGIGLHVIDCDLRHHTNKTSDGIRAVVITEGKP